MKSKTSQDFIASESNGVRRDQEVKQKQLKKGKSFENAIEKIITLLSRDVEGVWWIGGFVFGLFRGVNYLVEINKTLCIRQY